jgi:aryl-alcohol dehydrogenase-like predicted oxidoreductase
MIWRGPERDVIPYSRDHGVSQIVWSPLGQGILTGKYRPGDRRRAAAAPPTSG